MVIDLNSGAYFSFVGAAADIWSLMASGAGLAGTVDRIAARYAIDVPTVQRDVGTFVAELTAHELLLDGSARDESPLDLGPVAVTYETPELERHDDLADLLLLDPVHEVD